MVWTFRRIVAQVAALLGSAVFCAHCAKSSPPRCHEDRDCPLPVQKCIDKICRIVDEINQELQSGDLDDIWENSDGGDAVAQESSESADEISVEQTETSESLPSGVRLGEKASDWRYFCADFANCQTTIAEEAGGIEGDSIRVSTDAPFDFACITESPQEIAMAADSCLIWYMKADNPNDNGWQEPVPTVRIVGSDGAAEYRPQKNLLPASTQTWVRYSLPIAGGGDWLLSGEVPSALKSVELHSDTWGGLVYQIWVDALTLSTVCD